MSEDVVKKKTPEFEAAKKKFLDLFFGSSKEEYVASQGFGCKSRKVLEAKLPKPFGCPLLSVQPCIDEKDPSAKVQGVVWFCDINGSICVCCREDFTKAEEEYPNYCPTAQVDDCEIHQGECEGCPSRAYCQPDEFEEPDDWEVEEWDGGF